MTRSSTLRMPSTTSQRPKAKMPLMTQRCVRPTVLSDCSLTA